MPFGSKSTTIKRRLIIVTTKHYSMNDAHPVRPLADYQVVEVFETRFAKVYSLEGEKIVLCELKTEYVPIAHFQDTFHRISELVKSGLNEKFIFDKRALRAFHQPSMEWYSVEWKRDMLEHGLRKHRKILPAEAWFRKSVMIAKDQIYQRYPDNILDQLDIKYCDTLEEAIAV